MLPVMASRQLWSQISMQVPSTPMPTVATSPAALLDAIETRGEKLQHLSTRQASLEDVFVELTYKHQSLVEAASD